MLELLCEELEPQVEHFECVDHPDRLNRPDRLVGAVHAIKSNQIKCMPCFGFGREQPEMRG